MCEGVGKEGPPLMNSTYNDDVCTNTVNNSLQLHASLECMRCCHLWLCRRAKKVRVECVCGATDEYLNGTVRRFAGLWLKCDACNAWQV